jgi:hypothetical protein
VTGFVKELEHELIIVIKLPIYITPLRQKEHRALFQGLV